MLRSEIRQKLIMESKISGTTTPPVKPLKTRIYDFCKEVVVTIKNKIVEFVMGIYHHWESITVMTLASLGVDAILSEIPFYWTLPMWIESTIFIPVISVLIVLGLMKIAEFRAKRRMA